jgi:mono/diheme cytochrome c family protein
VREGGSRFNSASFRSRMPAWGGVLTGEEIEAVIAYLKTLWGPEERAFQAEVSAQPTASP